MWRPEVLAGPKVLCNACGVKALYSYRSRVQAVSKSKATQKQHGSKAAGPQNQPAHLDAWQSNKRRRVLSSDIEDICVTPAQAHFIKVERSHDAEGKRVATWTVTDCSIGDTRQFSQAMHAQAFIDECWLFISADNRWLFTSFAAHACCSCAAFLACSMHATLVYLLNACYHCLPTRCMLSLAIPLHAWAIVLAL